MVAKLSCNQEMEMLAILDSIAALMELDQEVEEGEVSLFLTTVVGLIKNSSMVRVRVAAFEALEASGKHVACNMARQRERDYIMQVLGCIMKNNNKKNMIPSCCVREARVKMRRRVEQLSLAL